TAHSPVGSGASVEGPSPAAPNAPPPARSAPSPLDPARRPEIAFAALALAAVAGRTCQLTAELPAVDHDRFRVRVQLELRCRSPNHDCKMRPNELDPIAVTKGFSSFGAEL